MRRRPARRTKKQQQDAAAEQAVTAQMDAARQPITAEELMGIFRVMKLAACTMVYFEETVNKLAMRLMAGAPPPGNLSATRVIEFLHEEP